MARAWLLLPCLALAGCAVGERPAGERLVVSVSRDLAPLIDGLARRFEGHNPGALIDIDPGAAERGAADVRSGLADVGVLGRPPRPDEAGLHAAPFALGGVAVVVHPDNPVRDLDGRQLTGLFTGQYTNWREVGGADRAVTLVGQAPGRAMRDVFLDHFALPSATKTASPVASGEQAVAAVAADAGAIGYACLGRAERAQAEGAVRALPLGGVAATLDELRAGRYPLSRPLLLLTRGRPEGLAARFLDFARSPEARDVLDRHGLLPVRPPE